MHILIDSSALVYSAYFKYGIYNYSNEPVAIVFGFMKKVLEISEKYKTSNFIFCFDSKSNLRKDFYPDYKKQRLKMNDEDILISKLRKKQEHIIRKELRNIGFRNVFLSEGYEADDLLSYWAKRLYTSDKIIMFTNDKDMYQNLNYCDIVNPKDNKHYSKRKFIEDYNITPDQWILAKAIGGCNSDNIQGIKGASDPKNITSKAIKYLRGEIKKGVLYDRIVSEEGQSIIERNLKLVSCPYDKKNFRFKLKQNYINRRKFISFINKYGFNKFLENDYWNNLTYD